MAQTAVYPVFIQPLPEGGYVAGFRDLPELAEIRAATFSQVRRAAGEALAHHAARSLLRGKVPPEGSEPRGDERPMRVPALPLARFILAAIARASKLPPDVVTWLQAVTPTEADLQLQLRQETQRMTGRLQDLQQALDAAHKVRTQLVDEIEDAMQLRAQLQLSSKELAAETVRTALGMLEDLESQVHRVDTVIGQFN